MNFMLHTKVDWEKERRRHSVIFGNYLTLQDVPLLTKTGYFEYESFFANFYDRLLSFVNEPRIKFDKYFIFSIFK